MGRTEEDEKWRLIKSISDVSNERGDKLIDLMESAGVNGLIDVTAKQAQEYCIAHEIGGVKA